MRAPAFLLALLLAVPFAAAEPLVLASGTRSFEGAGHIVVPFVLPVGTTGVVLGAGAVAAGPVGAYAATLSLVHDGVPQDVTPCALAGMEPNSQSACIQVIFFGDATVVEETWELHIDAVGSGRVGFEVSTTE